MVITEGVGLGLKRPDGLSFTIVEKLLMVMVDVYIGIIPPPFPTIIQVSLV